MTSEDRDRTGRLLVIQGTEPDQLEDRLLRSDIARYGRAPSSHPGANWVSQVKLADGSVAFHKPLTGVRPDLARRYGHEPLATTLNEAACWRLARFLGDPYSLMVPTTVYRFHRASAADRHRESDLRDGWGSLSARLGGDHLADQPLSEAAINDVAAFFDALVANQDRHLGNYRWDDAAGQLGLLDHGFTFPNKAGMFNESVFVARRAQENRMALAETEKEALTRVKNHPSWAGLEVLLLDEQFVLLRARVEQMLKLGELIPYGQRGL